MALPKVNFKLENLNDIRKTKSNDITLLILIFQHLDAKSLALLGCTSRYYQKSSSMDLIWKPLCIFRWPELKMSKSIDFDPFPAWKNCYNRKHKEDSTSMKDLMNIFGACDWYTCPNGHLYVIGECRLPVQLAKCPECGLSIGGKYHRMVNTNKHIGIITYMLLAMYVYNKQYYNVSYKYIHILIY